MAKYEDYIKVSPEVDAVEEELVDASQQQEDRETSTPTDNWEERYKNLEVAYSRQGQTMGDYRKLIDDYVTTTPDDEAIGSQEVNPVTTDDIYENPAEAINRTVDAHPAIKRVEALEKELQDTKVAAIRTDFEVKHPKYQDTIRTPEFANWVAAEPLRTELAQRADQFDMTAADALFTLYNTETAPAEPPPEVNLDEVSLETGTGAEPPAPDQFSRSEMLSQKIRAKQGDPAARDYILRTQVAYREAMAIGNVRD